MSTDGSSPSLGNLTVISPTQDAAEQPFEAPGRRAGVGRAMLKEVSIFFFLYQRKDRNLTIISPTNDAAGQNMGYPAQWVSGRLPGRSAFGRTSTTSRAVLAWRGSG